MSPAEKRRREDEVTDREKDESMARRRDPNAGYPGEDFGPTKSRAKWEDDICTSPGCGHPRAEHYGLNGCMHTPRPESAALCFCPVRAS